MKESKILYKLGIKEIKAEDLAEKVLRNPDLLPEIFNGISSANPRIKFKSAKF